MRTVTVTLGTKEYTIKQLPMRQEAEWRTRLKEHLQPVMAMLKDFDKIEFNGPADVATFLQQLAPMLLDAPEIMLDLLFAYSPELAVVADQIEGTAYSDQVMEALKAVIALAYPFGRELMRLSQLPQQLPANGVEPQPLPTT